MWSNGAPFLHSLESRVLLEMIELLMVYSYFKLTFILFSAHVYKEPGKELI